MDHFVFPPFRLDVDHHSLWRETTVVPLRPKTFAVLQYLITHRGRFVSNDELLQAMWPDVVVGEAMPRLCIRELRQALGDDVRHPRFIETQPRRGYRFIAPLTTHSGRRPTSGVRNQGSSPTPMLVGREVELQHLHDWFAQARNGARQIVFITGEPGIGKTTVVEAFLAQLTAGHNDLKVAQGQCIEQYGVGEAYRPILEALERLGRELGNDALRTFLYRHAPTWLMHLPSLITPAEREELQRQLAGTGQARMLRELAQALEVVTTDAPLVLWLEDLHWSDQATLVLLAALARRPEPARLMILATYRPADIRARVHRLRQVHQELQLHGYCTEVALQPLNAMAVAEYIARLFVAEHTSSAFLQRVAPLIHQRTEGNPLFMINVLDHLVTQGVLVQREGFWELAGTIETVSAAIPTTIWQFLEQQLDRLSPADQRLLEVASVAGAEFSAAAVAAGVEAAVPAIEERCATLGRHGQFVQARGSEEWPDGTVATRYGFLHALYHDVLYERVPAGWKVALHRRIGGRLEHAYGNRAHERAAELAMHFARGHEYSRAGHYHAEAGKQALQRSAHHEAISHLTTGRELLNTLTDTSERAQRELALQITLGTALMATKGYAAPEAAQAYTRARELCQQVNDPRQLCVVLWGLRTYYNGRAEFHTALEVAERLLAIAQQLAEPALLVVAHRALGHTLYFQGDVVAAYAHFAQGIALYDLRDHRSLAVLYENDPGVVCLCFAAVVLWNLGYSDQARQRMQEALQLAQDVAHPSSQALALALAAALHHNLREVHTTRTHAETLLTLTRTHGFAGWLPNGMFWRGWALAQQGQADAGLQEIHQGLTTLRTAGIELNRPRYLMALAEACTQAGQYAAGLAALTEALALIQRTGGRLYEAELYRLYGEITLRLGAVEAGDSGNHTILADAPLGQWPVSSPEAAFQTAIAMAKHQQAKSLELRAVMSLARLWQQQGKRHEARQVLAEVYGWFTEGFDTADLQEARALLEALGA